MADISTLVVKVDTKDVTKAKASLESFAKTPATVVKENAKLEKSNTTVNKTFTTLGKSVVALGVTYLGAQGILATAKLADEYTQLNAKLKLTADTTEEFEKNYKALYAVSQETGTSFINNAQNFANMSLALEATNIQSEEMIKIFETVNKSLVVSGASTAEASSFMLQFRQAMGSGVLQGEEFRAMMESNSFFGLKLAEALDTDIAGLRKMKEEGLLTTDAIRQAIPDMFNEIDDKFQQLPITMTRAIQELRNSWGDLVNDANTASGATTQIAESIQLLARYVEDNKEGIASAFVVAVELTTELLSTIINITNSLRGWQAVGDDRLSIFEFATMDAKELSEWMKKDSTGIHDLNSKLIELKETRVDVANSWAFTSTERQGKEDRLHAIDLELETTKNLVSVIENEYIDNWQRSTEIVKESSANKIILLTNESEKYKKLKEIDYEYEIKLQEKLAKSQAEASAKLLAQKKKDAEAVLSLNEELTEKVNKLTLSEVEYSEWALKKEYEQLKLKAKGNKANLDLIDVYYKNASEEIIKTAEETAKEQEEILLTSTDKMIIIGENFADDIGDALGQGLGDVFVEEFGGIEGAWGSMWDNMLSAMGNAVVDMSLIMAEDAVNAIFSTDFDYFHSGSQGIKADETMAVLQEGEMVIPTSASNAIRANLGMTGGSGGSGGDFSGLVEATAGISSGTYGGSNFADNVVSSYGSKAKTALTSALFSGDFSGSLKTLMGPGTALNVLASAGTKEIKSQAGLTGVYAETGGSLANLLSALTLSGVVGGPLGILAGAAVNLLGSWGGDAFGDLVDDRENESLLDSYEEGNLTKEELAKRIQSANRYGSKPGDVSTLGSVIDGVTDFIDGVKDMITSPFESAYNSISNYFNDIDSNGFSTSSSNDIDSGGDYSTSGSDQSSSRSAGSGGTSGLGGYASGGVVDSLFVPDGDDGLAGLKFGEGVLDTDTMGVLKRNIRTGSMGANDKLLSNILDAITAGSYEIAKNTLGTYKLIRKFDIVGMPETRTT